MKARESGMPPEEMWSSFYDADMILRRLGFCPEGGDVVEFGCGYGTFTVPAARLTPDTIYALDIEPAMAEATQAKVTSEGLQNVTVRCCDFLAQEGTGLPPESVRYAMLFNILHLERPLALLREAFRILRKDGQVGVVHWNYDPTTPRGPSMAIRPRPDQCREWLGEAGLDVVLPEVDLPPYHYGVVAAKATSRQQTDTKRA